MKYSGIIVGILFVMFMVTVTACGGGTSGSNGGTNGGGPFSSVRMEAILSPAGTSVDPSNVFSNEIVQFRLTGLDEGQVGTPRVVIPTSGYTLTGTPGGSLTTAGLFSATTPTGSIGTVRVTFDGTLYSSGLRVIAPEAILVGSARTTTGLPTPGIQIKALNPGGTVVATGLVAADGTIRMSTPTSAVRFTADFSLVDPGPNVSPFRPFFYVRQFAYATKDFSTTILTCTAPLPALTNGSASNLATPVVFYPIASGAPPPPPDGCQ